MKDNLIRLEEVKARTGLSRSSIYLFMKRSEFPKPVNIGPRAVAWVEQEINEWVKNRIRARRKYLLA